MAYDYEKAKKAYEGLTYEQKQQFADRYKNDATVQQFAKDYAADIGGSSRNSNTFHISYDDPNNPGRPTSISSSGVTKTVNNASRYSTGATTTTTKNWWDQGNGNYSYNPVSGYYEKVVNKGTTNSPTTIYGEDENHYGILDDKDKTNPQITYSGNQAGETTNPLLNTQTQTNQNVPNTNVDLTGGEKNTNMNNWGEFNSAVNNKLQTAFGLQDLNALKNKYPEQYSSLIQALDSVAPVWNSLDPSQRQLLEGQLQAIIGTAVGAGSDTSQLNVLSESILSKFKNPDNVKQFVSDVTRLKTEGMTTAEIAKQMGVDEDMVQQGILASNGLDNKLGEYFELTEKAGKDITEPYDTKIERQQKEKEIALERANRNVEMLTEDFNTQMERQKKANEVNAHNADMLSGQYGFGFSKRGIEGLDYVAQQAQQIIDDMVKNYDRSNQEIADGVADILRNWERNNEDLLKASEDALTNAKNVYTSNMLTIQQQYGTVGMQAQQQLANNVQNFITTAENIYDNALNRQQQNLSNLITNFSNLNALSYSNLTLRNAQIQQFQNESMNLNRNQLQGLAQQLGMDSASYQDLVNYQMQAVANQLNGYIPGAGVQLQGQIQNLLNSGYTPNQAIQSIMNSQEFKDLQAATAGQGENWSMSGGIMYNKATGQYIDLNGDEYGTIGDNLYNKRTGEIIKGAGASGGAGGDYVTSETINGKTYGVSQETYSGLVNFYNKYVDENGNIKKGIKGGQCGSFVNNYLQSLGLGRVFKDPIDLKVAAINTEEGYRPQIGDVVVMDSPTSKQYGHVAIVIGVDGDNITTLESNKKGEEAVFSRTMNINTKGIHGYYHPDGAGVAADNQVIIDLFNKDNLTAEDKKTIESFGMTLPEFGVAKKEYLEQNKGGESKDTPAYQLARAILNGTADKPAKNSSNYADVSLALDDLVNEEFGGKMPTKGSDLIRWSVIKEKDLDSNTAESIAGTFTSLMNTDSLMNLLEANDIQTGPIISRIAKLNPRNKGRAEIQAQINSMSASIARGFGEKGVLTDADIERYMKTIPNEKMGERAREAVGDLLKIALYRNLMTKLENAAKSGRDVSMYIDDYKTAENFLIEKGIIDKKVAPAGQSMGAGGGRVK